MEKPTGRIRGTTPEIEQAARHLRENPTPAEAYLWDALKGKQLKGLKFRRQHPVGRFIVDFYCPVQKLVIELDGEIHLKQKSYDAARTQQLEQFGYRVLRFSNQAVLQNRNQVLATITEYC